MRARSVTAAGAAARPSQAPRLERTLHSPLALAHTHTERERENNTYGAPRAVVLALIDGLGVDMNLPARWAAIGLLLCVPSKHRRPFQWRGVVGGALLVVGLQNGILEVT